VQALEQVPQNLQQQDSFACKLCDLLPENCSFRPICFATCGMFGQQQQNLGMTPAQPVLMMLI